jgi:hypothetical protein
MAFKNIVIIIVFSFLLSSLISCEKKYGLDFTVHNGSGLAVDSVVIATSGKDARVVIGHIEPDSSGTSFLDMTNVPPVDGNYYVSIIKGKNTFEDHIGYYTNGFPTDKKIEIWLSPKDSVRYVYILRTD